MEKTNNQKMRLGIVIVSYGHEKEILKLWQSLENQLTDTDKIIIVDNKPPFLFANYVKDIIPSKFIIEHDNGGFGAGCNFGANKIKSKVDILFFLNPDTIATDNLLNQIRHGGNEEFAAWMPLLLLENGEVNSAGNEVHISGLSWCSGIGQDPENFKGFFEVCSLSGACLAINVTWWNKIHGFEPRYFMYHEDVDISAKILLRGGKIGCDSAARVIHQYDYEKGEYKWLFIERNRYIFILLNWPASLITAMLPLLFAVELAIIVMYIATGKGILKLKANFSLIKEIRWVISERNNRKPHNIILASEYAHHLVFGLDTPMIGTLGRSHVINILLGCYYTVAVKMIKLTERKIKWKSTQR